MTTCNQPPFAIQEQLAMTTCNQLHTSMAPGSSSASVCGLRSNLSGRLAPHNLCTMSLAGLVLSGLYVWPRERPPHWQSHPRSCLQVHCPVAASCTTGKPSAIRSWRNHMCLETAHNAEARDKPTRNSCTQHRGVDPDTPGNFMGVGALTTGAGLRLDTRKFRILCVARKHDVARTRRKDAMTIRKPWSSVSPLFVRPWLLVHPHEPVLRSSCTEEASISTGTLVVKQGLCREASAA